MSSPSKRPTARADFHLWKFAEIYSNASGTVQFIELSNLENGETLLGGQKLRSQGQTFTFPADLPAGTPTENRRLLLATPGYFNLRGVPTADYNLGVNSFFSIAGDTLNFAGGLDVLTFSGAQLPTDTRNSLLRLAVGNGSGVNSPTNVAGAAGVFPQWENLDNRFDVNRSGTVTLIDARNVIDSLLLFGSRPLSAPVAGSSPPPFLDINGDNQVTIFDGRLVIDELLRLAGPRAPPPFIGQQSRLFFLVPEPASLGLLGQAAVTFLCLVWIGCRRRGKFGVVN